MVAGSSGEHKWASELLSLPEGLRGNENSVTPSFSHYLTLFLSPGPRDSQDKCTGVDAAVRNKVAAALWVPVAVECDFLLLLQGTTRDPANI